MRACSGGIRVPTGHPPASMCERRLSTSCADRLAVLRGVLMRFMKTAYTNIRHLNITWKGDLGNPHRAPTGGRHRARRAGLRLMTTAVLAPKCDQSSVWALSRHREDHRLCRGGGRGGCLGAAGFRPRQAHRRGRPGTGDVGRRGRDAAGGQGLPGSPRLVKAQVVQAGGLGAVAQAVDGFGGFAKQFEQIEKVSARHRNFWKCCCTGSSSGRGGRKRAARRRRPRCPGRRWRRPGGRCLPGSVLAVRR